METTVDESKPAATTAVKEKTTSANAEVPGSKAEEANTKDGWQEVRARERRVPTPPSPPLEQEPMKYVEVHLQGLVAELPSDLSPFSNGRTELCALNWGWLRLLRA